MGKITYVLHKLFSFDFGNASTDQADLRNPCFLFIKSKSKFIRYKSLIQK